MREIVGTILPYLMGALVGMLLAAPSTFGDFFRQVGDQWANIGRWVWQLLGLRPRRRVVNLKAKDLYPLETDIRINGDTFVVVQAQETKQFGGSPRITIELADRDDYLAAHTMENR